MLFGVIFLLFDFCCFVVFFSLVFCLVIFEGLFDLLFDFLFLMFGIFDKYK